MLYLFHATIISLWLVGVISKGKYSWHAIINAYCIFLLTIDAVETITSPTLGLYTFSAHLFSDPVKDGLFGFIMSDGIILPFSTIILCHYVIQIKKYWYVIIAFILLHITLELVYLRSGYLLYLKWHIGLSCALYLLLLRRSQQSFVVII